MRPTDDAALNAIKKKELEDELRRVERNRERREQREKVKGRASNADAPSAASPGQSSADGTTPQKTGRGKKDGTARKCANCGQVGHIKTNRKSVSFRCLFCESEDFVRLASDVERFGPGDLGGLASRAELVL